MIASKWANELVSKINLESRTRARDRADAAISYLKSELMQTQDVGTREAVNRLIEVQIRQRMLANVSQEYAFRIVDRATPPDRAEYIWPSYKLLLLLWIPVSLIIGVAIALSIELFRSPRVSAVTLTG